MSTRNAPPRPRQVTTAGVMGVVGSVLLVFSLFDALGRVRSVEMRSEVEEFLSAPPGNGLGLSSDAVLDALHGMVLLNGALAAAAAVLAVYVFQRHQAARVGFTVAAALLLFTAPVSGGLMAMVVAFAATMLWSRPARDWFAGRQPAPAFAEQRPDRSGESGPSRADWPPPASRPADSGPPLPPPPAQAPARPSPSEAPPAQTPPAEVPAAWTRPGRAEEAATPPPASYPFGTRPDPSWAPPGVGQQPGVPAWAVGTRQDPDRRPGGVTLAAVLSWVFAGATALAFLLVVLMLMFARQDLVDAIQADPQFESLPMSTEDLLAALWVMSAVCLFWSVSALVLAALAFRRLGWARYALVGSAAMTLLVSLLAFPFGLLHAAAAVVTIAMLLGRRASAWYARRPADLPPGGYGGPSTPGPYGGPSAPGPYGGPPAPPPADQNPPPPQPGGDQGVPPAPPYPPPGRKQKPPVW